VQAQLDLSAERIGAYISANCNPESANFTIYDTVNATIGNLTYIQVGPVNYGYYLFGNKSSDLPPLVMIPGWTGTIANWPVPLLQQLAATRQVLIFDNRGIGFSTDSAPASELTMESMAASTVDLIAALKLKKPDIFGWSMGGEIGLTMAVLFPDKIGKIMSLGGDLGGPTDLAEDAPQYGPVMAALSSSNSSDAAQMMRMSALFPAWLNDTDLPGMGACNLMCPPFSPCPTTLPVPNQFKIKVLLKQFSVT
jgi:pimeloyl-ACP methyl ester carboxylesterase